MGKRIGVAVMVGVVLALSVAGAVAQERSEAQKKVLAARAARVDALRKLAEEIYGLQITSETTVRDAAVESDEIRTAVRAVVRGAKEVGRPRYYSDGACDVTLEVTLETVITTLTRIADGYIKKGRFKGDYFQQIKQHTKRTTITAVGSGAPREDVEYEGDYTDGLAIGVSRTSRSRKIPAGWENVTAQGRIMAMRAARVDALRKIAERVYGVIVESQTEVRDAVVEEDFIRAFTRVRVVGAKETGQRYMSDGIAETDLEMTLETVKTTTRKVMDGYVKRGKFTGDYLKKVMQSVKFTRIKETGQGVPPARYIRGETVAVGVTPPPDWSRNAVKVTGSGAVDQAMLAENQAQAWLMAERAAELDAKRKLGEQVYGVRIDSTTTVRDFVAEHDEIQSDMSVFLSGARVVAKRRLDDGTAEVDVELPLERLWLIIARVK